MLLVYAVAVGTGVVGVCCCCRYWCCWCVLFCRYWCCWCVLLLLVLVLLECAVGVGTGFVGVCCVGFNLIELKETLQAIATCLSFL